MEALGRSRALLERWGDLIIVGALLVVAELDVWAARAPADAPAGWALVNALLVAGFALPLLMRRRAPLVVVVLVIAAGGAQLAYTDRPPGSGAGWLALNVALYSVAAHGGRRTAIAGAALVAAVSAIQLADGGGTEDVLSASLFLGAVWALGRWVRVRRRGTRQLEERARRLAAEGELNARLAVERERARIARELHDSIAHSVSVMVLQAGAAEQVVMDAPERARASLTAIQDVGRDAVVELRRLLMLLRSDDDTAPLAPRPGIAGLDTLLAHVRDAGLPVVLSVEGKPEPLPTAIDLSAYRIVQEGLTNTLKHAGPAHARVTLRYSGHALELEILDDGDGDGCGAPDPQAACGFGLAGMRERASLYGGVMEAGPRDEGGYVLRARLPLERTPS
jgi:signal transduction histidine kinase